MSDVAGPARRTDLSADWSDRIFVFWLGNAPLTEARRAGLESLATTECNVHLVTDATLQTFAVAGHPFHAALPLLSPVHRADYLRCYFMHHFGGGYTDIKRARASWRPAFAELKEKSDFCGVGYGEVDKGVAKLHRSRVGRGWHARHYLLGEESGWFRNRLAYERLKRDRGWLIGNCAFIFRPLTEFTGCWLRCVEQNLDVLLPLLREHPARNPRDRQGVDHGDGPSLYPVPWTFLLGDILAPLSYRYRHALLRTLPAPDFADYA